MVPRGHVRPPSCHVMEPRGPNMATGGHMWPLVGLLSWQQTPELFVPGLVREQWCAPGTQGPPEAPHVAPGGRSLMGLLSWQQTIEQCVCQVWCGLEQWCAPGTQGPPETPHVAPGGRPLVLLLSWQTPEQCLCGLEQWWHPGTPGWAF